MSRTVYVNGEYVAAENARISVFDRGFLFGDGVYEVIPVVRGRLVDKQHALQRLDRSLGAIGMTWPCAREELIDVLEQLLVRDNVQEGMVYLQVTRGAAERDFAFPKIVAGEKVKESLIAWASAKTIIDNPLADSGVAVVSIPDLRWKRRDIKSVSMLAQCLAKQAAAEQGAYEGWMIEEGQVTEGVSSSAFIVKGSTLITRALSNSILPGIRRKVIVQMAHDHGIALEERTFTLEEACAADEAFMSSATTLVLPIVSIDGKTIGSGKPGPVAQKLRAMYVQMLLDEAGN
ncbi:MAG: D-amino-acid transaminase [Gammaproteobacteria bacterium]|nr:D-amino-acid transaminase [Gammaproteobacteria bacterium]MDP2347103.1 D-amino-acid transaminase [Gammaproteobacteria bacterium]